MSVPSRMQYLDFIRAIVLSDMVVLILHVSRYYRRIDMVARSDDLIQAFRATGCKPQQSPKSNNLFCYQEDHVLCYLAI
jgi:hypothetical protein